MPTESVAMPRLSTFRISQSLVKSKKCNTKPLEERYDPIYVTIIYYRHIRAIRLTVLYIVVILEREFRIL